MPTLIAKLTREIEGQLDLFASLWPRYAEAGDTEAPHRQRTAVNRLTGYAAFLGIAHRKSEGLEALRAWRKRVGPIRDIDVMREWSARAAVAGGERAALAAVRLDAELLAQRTALLEQVRRDTVGYHGAQARIGVESARAEFRRALAASDTIDRGAVIRVVAEPWRKKLDALHHSMRDDEMHTFRVANKRLRFVLELLDHPAAPTVTRAHTALGDLSDLWVFRHTLRRHRAAWALAAERTTCNDAAHLESGRAALEEAPMAAWLAVLPMLAAGELLSLAE